MLLAGGRSGRLALLAALSTLVPAALSSPSPCQAAPAAKPKPVAAPPAIPLETLLAPEIGSLAFAPDGSKVYLSMDADGLENVYSVPAAGGGAPEALTRSTAAPMQVLAAFPNDERLLLATGRGGDDPRRLVVRERDGALTELSPGKVSRFKGWSTDGKSFLLEEDDRGAQASNLYAVEASGYARTLVNQNTSLYPLAQVSADRRFFAFAEIVSEAVQSLRIQDKQTGQKQLLRSGEGMMVHIPVAFTPDDKALLYIADTDSKFRYLEQIDPAKGSIRPLVHEVDGDVLGAVLSPDGRYAAVTYSDAGTMNLHLYDAQTWARVPLPGMPYLGEITAVAFSRDSRSLAVAGSSSRVPPEVYVLDVGDPLKIGAPRRLLAGSRPAPDPKALADAESVTFKSADGTSIQGFLYRPPGSSAMAPAKTQAKSPAKGPKSPKSKLPAPPAVVYVHDGPGGSAWPGYRPLLQLLAQRGYLVLAVNHRGSLGFGKMFLRLDDRGHGAGDVDDCIAAKTYLATAAGADPRRIAVAGEGHGGYLALAALAFHPAEFASGADLFGVADWIRLLNSIPIVSFAHRSLSEEFGDAADVHSTRFLSPALHAADIVRPLFLVQGGRDTLALPEEAATLVTALQARHVPVSELLLEDEGHGLSRRANRLKAYAALADFLDAQLKTGGGPGSRR
jgi:dipeptidyl aminopeptidase/acylaminoacyl peptidase